MYIYEACNLSRCEYAADEVAPWQQDNSTFNVLKTMNAGCGSVVRPSRFQNPHTDKNMLLIF